MAKRLKKLIKKSLLKAKTEKISSIKKTKIKVIGIGGGGSNIVSELAERIKKATFLAVNTDLQALKQVSRKVEPFLFGQNFTHGLGTGMKPEIAEMASQNEKERIKKTLEAQDLVIFIACLGGGVGSGATPIFTKISQNLGNLSYGIFTLPFKFEGERKMEIAKRALEILRPKLNAITILPNERIFQVINKTTPLREAFSAINKSLTQSLEGLIETIYQPGLINIDFADLRTILTGSRGRLAYLNTLALARKEGIAKEMVEKVLTSPLYPYGIKGAKGVLFNIVGQKELSLEEVSQISKTISEKTHKEAKIIFGIQPFSSGKRVGYQNIIKTTIFATGCPTKIFSGKAPKKLKQRKTKQPRKKSIKKEKVNIKAKYPEKIKKIKLKKPEEKLPLQTGKSQQKKEINKVQPLELKMLKNLPAGQPNISEGKVEVKVRKNALQLKKEIEQEEREMLEKERFWEVPTFLRKKLNQRPEQNKAD
jgi:cell division protein FtsZ